MCCVNTQLRLLTNDCLGFIGLLPIQWIFDLAMDINSVGSPHLQFINIGSLTYSQYQSINSFFFFQSVIFCTPLFIPHTHVSQLLSRKKK